MILALLLAAAAPQTAVDAERAFAAKAQTDGMWTAFRATAADDAIMFVPQPTRAHDFLKDRKDPQIGYMWWPAKAYVSCDGKVAATTGPSVLGASRGYFTTIWIKQDDGGWKWIVDHGDTVGLPQPASDRSEVRTASCKPVPPPRAPLLTGARSDKIAAKFGWSPDRSLSWGWQVKANGERTVSVEVWDGERKVRVISDKVAAPTQ